MNKITPRMRIAEQMGLFLDQYSPVLPGDRDDCARQIEAHLAEFVVFTGVTNPDDVKLSVLARQKGRELYETYIDRPPLGFYDRVILINHLTFMLAEVTGRNSGQVEQLVSGFSQALSSGYLASVLHQGYLNNRL